MASYGRNFEFLVPPEARDRDGQCVTPTTGSRLPIGVPIQYDLTADPNTFGLQPVKLSTTGNMAAPASGICGILVYEEVQFRGVDPALTTYSDPTIMTTAPKGVAVQRVSGRDLYVIFKNTVDQVFLGASDITGRKMVAGIGQATPTLTVGNYLKPGVGNDTDGYWTETAVIADAWLVVTAVNNDRAECEARLLI